MPRGTSFDELYNTLGALVLSATGRPWWRKAGIQARPKEPYAIVYLAEGMGLEKQVVEHGEIAPYLGDEVFTQTPWGTTILDVRLEFYGSRENNTALEAATRLRQALYLEERFWDLWELCALNGGVRLIDLSQIFREDVEGRTELRFSVIANITEPAPLADKDIYDIQSQQVNVTHVKQDGEETLVEVVVNDTTESSS